MSRLTFLIRAAAVAAVTTSLALVGATGGVSQATTAPSFTVKVLSPFGPNAGDDYPTGLNNAGQIVGYVQSSSAIRGFFYEPGTGGSGRSYAVPVPKGDHAAAFNAVDNGSLAAGFVCVDEACKHYLPYAGRIAGSTAALFALRPPSTQTLALGSAYAIDAAGDVTGFVRLASGQSFGVEWRNRGSLSKPSWSTAIRLSAPSGFVSAYGTAVDRAGDVGGFAQKGSIGFATISGPLGGVQPLSGFRGTAVKNVIQSYAAAALSQPSSRTGSGNGSAIVVGSSYESGSGQNQYSNPAAWRVTIVRGKVSRVSKPFELGTDYNDPNGGLYGGASSMNAHGWTVGLAGIDNPTAMLWMLATTAAGGLTDSAFQLQTLTPQGSPACDFNQAVSVNDRGQVVGTFLPSGNKYRPSFHSSGSSAPPCAPVSTTYQSIYLLTPVSRAGFGWELPSPASHRHFGRHLGSARSRADAFTAGPSPEA
ncbi:MAG TPA: hypothetical protein VFB34_03520 [Chloroflexota bacterium]|nr:hypothetical protein [Chloroflexota bacterium]